MNENDFRLLILKALWLLLYNDNNVYKLGYIGTSNIMKELSERIKYLEGR